MALMNEKYILYIINKMISVKGPLRVFLYLISVRKSLPHIWIIHIIILKV